MSRKTPSTKKGTTLFAEIRREFSGHFERLESKAGALLAIYPKTFFISMLVFITLSIVGVILIPLEFQFNKPKNAMDKDAININGNSQELNLLMDLGNRAKRIYNLQKEIEQLLQKEQLSTEDSAFLDQALGELEYFEH